MNLNQLKTKLERDFLIRRIKEILNKPEYNHGGWVDYPSYKCDAAEEIMNFLENSSMLLEHMEKKNNDQHS